MNMFQGSKRIIKRKHKIQTQKQDISSQSVTKTHHTNTHKTDKNK
jgi:hypothetical protein